MNSSGDRKILITNDDGIDAGGIIRLAEAAREFGEVWVVAPGSQRSSAAHSSTLRDQIEIKPYEFAVEGVKAYACSGLPADCVRLGCLNIMPERPDVVLSGINNGYNVASDVQYSATAGAAFEAAFQGCLGIALSEDFGDCREITDVYLKEVLAEFIDVKLSKDQIININFPCGKAGECRGIKRNVKTSVGAIYKDRYKLIEEREDGTFVYMVDGIYNEEAEEGSDFRAVLDKYIAVGIVKNVG